MPALYLTYQKKQYRLRYEQMPEEGIWLNESPYQINLNLRDRDLDPEEMTKPGSYAYMVTKYDRHAMLTVKGPGAYFQVLISDEVNLDDFYRFCFLMRHNLSMYQLMVTWLYASLENIVSFGLRFPRLGDWLGEQGYS